MQFTAFPGTCTKCAALLRPLSLLSCRLISPVKSRAEQIRAHTLLGDELHPWSSKKLIPSSPSAAFVVINHCPRLSSRRGVGALGRSPARLGFNAFANSHQISGLVYNFRLAPHAHTRTLAHTRTTRHIKILAPNKHRTRNIFRRFLASLIASNLNNISLRFYL